MVERRIITEVPKIDPKKKKIIGSTFGMCYSGCMFNARTLEGPGLCLLLKPHLARVALKRYKDNPLKLPQNNDCPANIVVIN